MNQTKTFQIGNISIDIDVTTYWNDDNYSVENNILVYLSVVYDGKSLNRVCWQNLDSGLSFGKRATNDEIIAINDGLIDEALLWLTPDYLGDEVDRQYKIAGYLNEILKNGGYKK